VPLGDNPAAGPSRGEGRAELIALVWSAFPGFRFGELMGMRATDLRALLIVARREQARRRLEAIEASMAPWMDHEARATLFDRLQEATMSRREVEERWAANRAMLRNMFRRG